MEKYTIPLIPPSLNKYAGRTNSWEYRNAKAEWRGIVCAYCRPKRPPPPFAHLRITFYFADRRRHDADNYCKFLLDGLVSAGVIADDDFAHVAYFVRGGVDKDNPRTEVLIDAVQYTGKADAGTARSGCQKQSGGGKDV